MANRARNTPGTTNANADDSTALENLQSGYERNKKAINTAITVVLLAVVGYFAYQKMYKAPREEKAGTDLSYAQSYFQVDSLDKALNGDGQRAGFLRVIKKYDGTDAANLSHYYAGICYLKMGEFTNAIKHLNDFNGKGTLVAYAAWGALGDAYMETNNVKKGIEFYKKASEAKDNPLYTPTYLYRLAIACEMNNQPDEAKKAYKRILDEYPQSAPARDVPKYLARLGEIEQ